MKHTTKLVCCLLALFVAVSACKKGDEEVKVAGVTLNETAVSLTEGDTLMLSATITPSDAKNKNIVWASDSTHIATVSNGMVIAVTEGVANITVTTEDGGYAATCAITVKKAVEPHPVFGIISFKTDKTWTVGEQTWSDAVIATGCEKTDFDGGSIATTFKVDCRQSVAPYGHLFSWEALNQHQDALCPDDWRAPTNDDFVRLDLALGGDGTEMQLNKPELLKAYIDEWGAEFAGRAVDNSLNGQNTSGVYWTLTPVPNSQFYYTLYLSENTVDPLSRLDRKRGFTIRCIKN